MNDLYPKLADAIQTIAVFALPLLFGITLHVSAQCFLAYRLGDRTAQMAGRLSLNPAKHIDPVGTILLPVIGFIVLRLTGLGLLIGYAKPLPINFGNLNNPKRGMLWIALAGVGSNFVMAIGWTLLRIALVLSHVDEPFFLKMTEAGIEANLVLIGFSLIPLPQFDGGRIVYSLLRDKAAYEYAKIEPYSMIILLVVLIPGWLWKYWVIPLATMSDWLRNLILSPLNYLFN
jgi:Zn-dependent protease